MKIKKVGYGYTQNLGNYEAAKVYAEIEVETKEGADPDAADKASDGLRTWVHLQLPDPSNIEDLKLRARAIERKIDQGIEALTRLRNKWDDAIALLEKHGITITEEFPWKPQVPEPPPDIPDFPLLDEEEVVEYEDPDEYI
ncbi:hypothetical protein [Oscillatoria acuminata]|uniref:Uncharacterized protein n=1 Tax=Oscillatoria acuminata PCC 6304 TaxID=56110 RepID=K9TB98_9CYAN|nr:hypothetical protein [Oscillatoria acuminata]AFY80177.1 hypothetical protein Oscil6304_0428 [Oscillatoria acuminata PCC 6304]